MKRYIKNSSSKNSAVFKADIIFNVELADAIQVAAATYKGHEIPEGDLPPADKDEIMNSQIYQNYLAFLDVIDDIIDDYDLHVYYANESEFNSFYRSALALGRNNELLFDFTVRIRVSTHTAHRTKESQSNKKKEKLELSKLSNGKRVASLSIIVVINDKSKEFKSYLDAIAYFDEEIAHAVEIMTRRDK